MRQHKRVLGLILLGITALVAAGCAEGTEPEAMAICGDNSCNGDENAHSCPQDCAGAAAVCGDGTCNGSETINTCPQDCSGASNPVCGDNICNGTETASSCPGDCAAAGSCGDTICNNGETSSTCPVDCPATATCGNAVCEGDEATTCPSDCTGGGGSGCGDLVCDVAGGECTSADINCVLDCIFDDQCGGGGGGGGTCDHDVCTTGTPLDSSCGTCEASMCSYDSYCCTTDWDSFCVSEVVDVCATGC